MSQRALFFGAAVIVIGLFGLIVLTQGRAWFASGGITSTSTVASTSTPPDLGNGTNASSSANSSGTPPQAGEVTRIGLVTSTYESAKAVVIEEAQSGGAYYLAQDSGTKYFDESGRPVTLNYIRRGFTVRAVGVPTKSDTMVPREVRVVTAPNILLYAPVPDSTIGVPAVISGQARVFENQFSYRITDAAGKVLGQGSANAQSPDTGQFGPYEIHALYDVPSTAAGFVEVYDNSAKDGTEIDKVRVPVKFSATSTASVKVYLSSRTEDPQGEHCDAVYPVTRTVAKTATPARTALEALLAGPTATESEDGYFTSINPGVTLNSVTITNGTATADFDAELERAVGGSCRVAAIRAQITRTLLQFPSVKAVVISVNGRTEDILQP